MKKHQFLLTLIVGVALCVAVEPNCPVVDDPQKPVHFPHPTDCGKFLTCSWGTLVEQDCPKGHYWNDQMKYCDYPENVDCKGTSPVPTMTEAALSDECPEVYDPTNQVYFPHDDCNKYYICTYEGNKLEQSCPTGFQWSQSHGYCDLPEVAQCS